MNKENLDKLMQEYYYEKNDIVDTINFLYTMAELYTQLNEGK